MTRLLLTSLVFALSACSTPGSCPEGQVLKGGACVDYEAGDPVQGEVWEPEPGTSWQIQYSGTLDPSLDVDMYNLDLFDTPEKTLEELHARGVVVLCYFSAGSYEDWRPDAGDFPEETLGEPLEGWAGEWWVDIRDDRVRQVMRARLDLAVERGCDGVDPDNVNGYQNPTGFDLTATEQLDFNRFLADEAHSRDLAVGLKNDISQVEELLPWFDWQLNEECQSYGECSLIEPFIEEGKAVFHIEYVDDWSESKAMAEKVCPLAPDFDTLIKTWDLGSEWLACP